MDGIVSIEQQVNIFCFFFINLLFLLYRYFEPKGAAALDFNFPSGRGFYMLKLNLLQSENCKNL